MLDAKAEVKCNRCGNRILYKKRTNKSESSLPPSLSFSFLSLSSRPERDALATVVLHEAR